MTNPKKATTIYIDCNVYEVMREVAFLNRTSRNDIMTRALRWYLCNIAIPKLQVDGICDKAKCDDLQKDSL